MLRTLVIIFILTELRQVDNIPLYKRSLPANSLPILISHETIHFHPANILDTLPKVVRKKKGPNLPVIPLQQRLLIPKLHVLPAQSNVHHSSVHTNFNHVITHDNIKIPVLTQTVSHTSSNITHPTPLIPIFVPIHHNFVPVHDLSVIPLQADARKTEKIGQFRVAMEKKEENFEEQNRYRTFYGGYGTGLFFGGHGAGHGYYAYGK